MNNYPQTSCPCQGCPKTTPFFVQPEPNDAKSCSLGIPNCNISPAFFCGNSQVYKQDIQPVHKKDEIIPLNSLGLRYAKGYTPVNCSDGSCPYGFEGHNPKLIDTPRAQLLILDKPHLTGEVAVGNVCHDEIYTPYYSQYGKNYANYSNMNTGQIQYYISTDQTDAYFKPNFIDPALVHHETFIDPMGVIRPQYSRQTIKQYDWDKCNKDECDSLTHDTLEFRQELMEKQMRKQNEQRWEPRWSKTVENHLSK